MLEWKSRSLLGIILLIFSLIYSIPKISLPDQVLSNKVSGEVLTNMPTRSKAEIVNELKTIKEKIRRLEEVNGQTGAAGYKVYSPEETGNLLNYYKALRTGLEYLGHGNTVAIKDWEGYPLEEKGKVPYGAEEAFQILTELEQNNIPPEFLSDYRVYLLPAGIPEISGLGGAGFAIISAPDIKDNSIEQLSVTLLHELGHHLHSRFMPVLTGKINRLWDVYHEIRGGEWQGPGSVNTTAWSNSSEETFAEDFRMLFGKNQPFYGDISLGDFRVNPEVVTKLKKFILNLKTEEVVEESESPWIPEGLQFWLAGQIYIIIGWLAIAVGMAIISGNSKSYVNKYNNYNFYHL